MRPVAFGQALAAALDYPFYQTTSPTSLRLRAANHESPITSHLSPSIRVIASSRHITNWRNPAPCFGKAIPKRRPVAVNQSPVAALAAASEITGLPRDHFELHEVSKVEFEGCGTDKQQNSLAQRSQRGRAAEED